MKGLNKVIKFAAVAIGVLLGVLAFSYAPLTAQKPTYDPKVGQAPVWETTVPAPPLPQGQRTMWPNQPDHATYWSIKDIRQAHEHLAGQETSGKSIDVNGALHDFPYWTRTHSMFVYHAGQKAARDSAQQHMGYAQFVVIMGGTGTLQAGGRISRGHVLTEAGQQILGEMRGDAIEGAKTYQLSEGDLVSIPPNTPAQFASTDRGGMTYMVMKVNAMLYPWDLIR